MLECFGGSGLVQTCHYDTEQQLLERERGEREERGGGGRWRPVMLVMLVMSRSSVTPSRTEHCEEERGERRETERDRERERDRRRR